jgi:hypothetical protein
MFAEGDDWSKFPGATLAELYVRLQNEYGASACGLDPNDPQRARVAMAVLTAAHLGSADFRTLEVTARALIQSSGLYRKNSRALIQSSGLYRKNSSAGGATMTSNKSVKKVAVGPS